jgi:tRNA pseudouridine38-40 synthase
MINLALRLAYDGTEYHGFQRQPSAQGRTVQDVLEKAWYKLFAEEIKLAVAGRTDAGVHAQGQVVNFGTEAHIPLVKVPKALNSLLPYDVRIKEAWSGGEDFNARRSALWKRYDYLIDNRAVPDVLGWRYRLHVPQPLDTERMSAGARYLEGKHDFRAFAAAGSTAKTFVRTLYHCRVERLGTEVHIICVGDGFLYNMVRIITGTLIDIGKNRKEPDAIPSILAQGRREFAGVTALAKGLILTHVEYIEADPSLIFVDLAES